MGYDCSGTAAVAVAVEDISDLVVNSKNGDVERIVAGELNRL